MLGAEVPTATPAVEQIGQKCVLEASEFVRSAQLCSCAAKNATPSKIAKTQIFRSLLGMYRLGRSLGPISCGVKHASSPFQYSAFTELRKRPFSQRYASQETKSVSTRSDSTFFAARCWKRNTQSTTVPRTISVGAHNSKPAGNREIHF